MLVVPVRSVLVPVALAAFTAALGGAVAWQTERVWAADQRGAASLVAAGAAFTLEQQVSRALSATYALSALVHHDEQLDDFDRLAAGLLPLFRGVAALQLAPGAVIRKSYPLAGNEAAIGHDLLRDPDRRLQAQAAVASRQLTVAGPFELKQGGMGLVGRLAVHLPDPTRPGGERLWGLVTAVVRLPPLLESARLQRLEEAGYRWRLTRHDPERQVMACFAGCDQPLAGDPVAFPVHVPNGAWTLSVAPAGAWPPPPWRRSAWAAVLASALVIALLSRQVLRQPELLRRQVAARTEELARANAALADEMRRLQVAEEAARAAEERLRQAQKMEAIGQLAGGIAHDFNNLLTGILGHASLLEAESPPGSEAAEAGATIADAARRASELTRRLLGFARRQPLRNVPFDAHAVVADVARLLARTLDARVAVRERRAAARAVVVGDPVQLQQALLNLAFNARDAMPEGGELTLETGLAERDEAWCGRHPGAQRGTHLVISVRDSGHGIAPELHDRVFEPFFTTKEVGKGTGLGLSMVYGIARAHGGGVDLASRPGEGACFAVSLPLAPEGVVAAPVAGGAGPRPSGAGLVLVIDDDEVPRRAAAAMLRACGYEPVVVACGEDGLRWLEDHPGQARAVLLDVAMPGMDGVSCLAALRRLDPGLRVVFASGYAHDDEAQALVARGEATFLPKPYDQAQLAMAIRPSPA